MEISPPISNHIRPLIQVQCIIKNRKSLKIFFRPCLLCRMGPIHHRHPPRLGTARLHLTPYVGALAQALPLRLVLRIIIMLTTDVNGFRALHQFLPLPFSLQDMFTHLNIASHLACILPPGTTLRSMEQSCQEDKRLLLIVAIR